MDPRVVQIAKACGWIFHKGSMNGSTTVERNGGYDTTESVPEYLTDLNAMHAAENELTWEQGAAYNEVLYLSLPSDQHLYHANAEQRAEAFIKVVYG